MGEAVEACGGHPGLAEGRADARSAERAEFGQLAGQDRQHGGGGAFHDEKPGHAVDEKRYSSERKGFRKVSAAPRGDAGRVLAQWIARRPGGWYAHTSAIRPGD